MPSRTFTVMLVALLVTLVCPPVVEGQLGGWESAVLAQSPLRETISGSGSATLKRPPGALRMYVEVFARGNTLEAALAKLKDRREAARMQLETLKADPQSIEFGSPSLSNPRSEQRSRFEAMVMQRMRSTGRKVPKGLQVPKSFTVSARLTAEWPLEADGPEACLLAAHAIEEKVKAADLAGAEDAKRELSPEEEELAEEMTDMMTYSGEQEIEPGTPHFIYVARVTDQDRDQAMAEAFQKAKANAARLARAAGARLGPLVGLSGHGGGREGAYDYSGPYGYQHLEHLQRLMGREGPYGRGEEEQDEAYGSDPGSLVFVFSVEAVFGLEKP